jgi:hypothetical protein
LVTGGVNLLAKLRQEYHRQLLNLILGKKHDTGAFSNADVSNVASLNIAAEMAAAIISKSGGTPCSDPPSGQTAGNRFQNVTRDFLQQAFGSIQHLRPGKWTFTTGAGTPEISYFEQYSHLLELQHILEEHPSLKAALGGDYLITPDIVIDRQPVTEGEINAANKVVLPSDGIAPLTPLRESNNQLRLLHASVSCKWTIRSDRVQNTRTEAQNLIRNRKGHAPIIVAVTCEPLPSRIASIALGTADIDCTYHAALHELTAAVRSVNLPDSIEMLETLVNGKRLRDISDLPFDLAI